MGRVQSQDSKTSYKQIPQRKDIIIGTENKSDLSMLDMKYKDDKSY